MPLPPSAIFSLTVSDMVNLRFLHDLTFFIFLENRKVACFEYEYNFWRFKFS